MDRGLGGGADRPVVVVAEDHFLESCVHDV
jgi:hypothetical protein